MEEDESETLRQIEQLESDFLRDYDMNKEDVLAILLQNLDDDSTEEFVNEFRRSAAYVEFLQILKESIVQTVDSNEAPADESPKPSKSDSKNESKEDPKKESKKSHDASSKSKEKDSHKETHSKKDPDKKEHRKDVESKKEHKRDPEVKKDKKEEFKKEHKKDGDFKKDHRKDGEVKKEHKRDPEVKMEHKKEKEVETKKEPKVQSDSKAPIPIGQTFKPIFKDDRDKPTAPAEKKQSFNRVELRPKMHPYFFKYEKKKKLKPFSIVLCDVKLMGSHFNVVNLKSALEARDKKEALIVLDKEKRKELNKREKLKRLHWEKVITINWKAVKKETERLRGEEESRDRERAYRRKKQRELERRQEERNRRKSREQELRAKEKIQDKKDALVKNDVYDSKGVRILPFEKNKDDGIVNFSKTTQEKYRMMKEKERREKELEKVNRQKLIEKRVEESHRRKPLEFKIPKIDKKPEVSSTTPRHETPLTNHQEKLKYDSRHHRPRRPLVEDVPMIIEEGKAWECGEDDYVPAHEPEEEEVKEDPDVIRPIEGEIKVNKMAIAVETFLKDPHKLKYPVDDSPKGADLNTEHAVAWKMSWWYLKSIIDPHQLTLPFAPELEEGVDSEEDDSDTESVDTFVGNVSDDGEAGCQSNVISSSMQHDPDKLDEYCGCTLLEAKIRIGELKENRFLNLFSIRPGTNYEKASFQAQCNICTDLIVGKPSLGAHVRSQKHKENIVKYSLDRTPVESKVVSGMLKRDKKLKVDLEMTKDRTGDEDIRSHTTGGLPIKIPARCLSGAGSDKDKRKRSISPSPHKSSKSPHGDKNRRRSRSPKRRSKSPRRRSRSRSRSRRRSRSPHKSRRHSPQAKRRKSKSPARSVASSKGSMASIKLFNKNEFCLRLTLTSEGKWTDAIQERWTCAEIEADRILKEYASQRKLYSDKPEEHPKYGVEWGDFWENRRTELEALGEDPEDTDNYLDEWKNYWPIRFDMIVKLELEEKMKQIKENHFVDYASLLRLQFNQAMPELRTAPPKPIDIASTYVKAPVPEPTQSTHSRQNKKLTPEKKSPFNDDMNYSPTPMSISSNSGSNPGKMKTPNPNPVTATDIAKLWDKMVGSGTNAPVTAAPVPPPQAPPAQPPLPKLLPPKTPSIASRSSYASLNIEGLDLVGVLQLVKDLQDQLSILAPKVEEFYTLAEKLDIEKPNKSITLLENEEFVHLLHHCRNRFNTLIKECIGSKEVLKQMNLTAYSLNEVLSHDLCSKFKPPTATLSLQVETMPTFVPQPTTVVKNKEMDKEPTPRLMKEPERKLDTYQENTVQLALRNVSLKCKDEIAWAIARALIDTGLEKVTDQELEMEVDRIFKPILENWTSGSRVERSETEESNNHFRRGTPGLENANLPRAPISSGSSNLSNDPKARPGTALPRLNLPEVRAASPPRNQPQGSSRGQNNNNGGRGQVSDCGRRSPFSQRDFSWNPDKSFLVDRPETRHDTDPNEVPVDNKYTEIIKLIEDLKDEDLFERRPKRPNPEVEKSNLDDGRYSPSGALSTFSSDIAEPPIPVPEIILSSHISTSPEIIEQKLNSETRERTKSFQNKKINLNITAWDDLEDEPPVVLPPQIVIIPSILPTAEDLGMNMEVASKMPLGILGMIIDEKKKTIRQFRKREGEGELEDGEEREEGELVEEEKSEKTEIKRPPKKNRRSRNSPNSDCSNNSRHKRKKSRHESGEKDRGRDRGRKRNKSSQKEKDRERSRDHEKGRDQRHRKDHERRRRERNTSPVSSILSSISNISNK